MLSSLIGKIQIHFCFAGVLFVVSFLYSYIERCFLVTCLMYLSCAPPLLSSDLPTIVTMKSHGTPKSQTPLVHHYHDHEGRQFIHWKLNIALCMHMFVCHLDICVYVCVLYVRIYAYNSVVVCLQVTLMITNVDTYTCKCILYIYFNVNIITIYKYALHIDMYTHTFIYIYRYISLYIHLF